MASPEFERMTRAAIEPRAVAAGFAPGQYSDQTNGVLYCAASDDFSDLHPWLPQSNAQPRGTGECLDLILNFDGHRYVDGFLEGYSLPETLRLLGHHKDADAIERLTGASLADALPSLAAAVALILDEPRQRTSRL